MKKLLTVVALILVISMLPLALFSCGSKQKPKETEANTENTENKSTYKKEDASMNGDSQLGSTQPVTYTYEFEGNSVTLEPTTVDLSVDHAKVKRLGRTTLTSKGIACDHSASGIEFKGIMAGEVTVKITSKMIKSNSPSSYYTVYVDGVRQGKRFAVTNTETLTIAKIKTPGEHTIRIVKQTESNYTISEIESIGITGYLTDRPADKQYYIEYIGDSLTCGMGNLGNSTVTTESQQSAIWEDASRSYAYMASEELGADYSVISQSGIGISYGWARYSIFPFYEAAGYNRDKDLAFDFENARVPDLMVINMGTNDYYINKDMDDGNKHCFIDEVIEDTEALITLVRTSYGEDMPIVWPSNFIYLGDNYVEAVEQGIINYAAKKTGADASTMTIEDAEEAAGIYRIDFTKNTGGAQGHPTVSGHTTAKNELIALIEEKGLLN